MPYQSAHDLPSFIELSKQLDALRFWHFLIPTNQRPDIAKMKAQLHRMGETVDRFYTMLGPRNWIFHDSLPLDDIARWLDEGLPLDEMESRLIAHYGDPETLRFLINQAGRHPAMRRRLPLIELARGDHQAGRYYATVHLLLSVMDGFVNEFETVRRGLHARQIEELDASDTVVSHHMGLANAHATFRKGKSRTSEEPVDELYRNGIVHGSLLNYNNEVVASKAWNRLFAVADWAKAREKEQQPPERPPTWGELFKGIAKNAEARKAIEAWRPETYRLGDSGFENHPAHQSCKAFLDFWQRKNYKGLTDLLPTSAHKAYGNRTIYQVRNEYAELTLESFKITEVNNTAPAICEIAVELRINGEDNAARLRWIHEDNDGRSQVASLPGQWHLAIWGPAAYLKRH